METLCHRLRSDGVSPWFDREQLIPGTLWQDGLAIGLRSAASCAIFIGKSDLGNWESEELHVAQNRAANDRAFRLIPVLLPGLPDPFDSSILPPFLLSRTWIDFRPGLDNSSAYRRLVCAIRGIPPGPEDGGLSDTATDGPGAEIVPYLGLETFGEADARLFFGRSADIQQLLEKLKAARFLAVIGASGAGKSSLVRAGLIPALRHDGLPGSGEWPVCIFKPGTKPLAELALQLVRMGASDQSPSALGRLEEELATDRRTLHNAARLALSSLALRQPDDSRRRMVVVVDQLEEIFTLCRDATERTRFVENLLYAASAVDGRTVVVLALRADFYPKCASISGLAALMGAHQYLLGPMTRENLAQVIEEPARIARLTVEPELVTEMLLEVGDQPGTLPLLEYALLEVWKRRRDGRLTLRGYWESGGVRGALAQRAETVFTSLTLEQQQIAQRILLRLTQIGDGADDTRRRATLAELIVHANERESVADVVNRLTSERLLTTSAATPRDDQIVDVAHEALIRGWPRFRKWVEEDRAGLRALMRLTEAANEWRRENRDKDLLYRGARLAVALELRGSHEAQLNVLEREFLAASVALTAQEQRRRLVVQRRQRNLSLALCILLVVAGLLSFNVRRQRDQARALLYVADMKSAVLASERGDVAEVRRALEAHVAESEDRPRFEWLLLWRRYHSDVTNFNDRVGKVLAVAFSPDGKLLASAGVDGYLVLWDVSNEQRIATLRGHTGNVRAVAFSPDGAELASAGSDNTVRLWDIRRRHRIASLTGHTGSVGGIAFFPNGRILVSAAADRTIRLWDLRSRQQIATMLGHIAAVASVAVSADGKWVASGSDDGTIRLWDMNRRAESAVLTGHSDSVGAVAFSPRGPVLASGSDDQHIILWDAETAKQLDNFRAHNDIVRSVAFSPDGQVLASASADETVKLWSVNRPTLLTTLRGHGAGVGSVAFTPNGRNIATGGDDGATKIWRVGTPTEITTLKGHKFHVTCILYSPDGRRVVSSSDDQTVRLWDPTTGQQLLALKGHTGRVLRVAFSPDSRTIASASDDKTVKLWDVGSGRNLATLRGHASIVGTVAFSPAGSIIASASDDQTIKLWNSATKLELTTLKGHAGLIRAIAFSPSGNELASGSHDGTVRLWDVRRHLTLTVFRGHTGIVRSVAFSPDGRTLASGSDDESIRLWDVQSRREVATLKGHANVIRCVAFTPDGRTLAAVSVDGTIEIWDIRTKRSIGLLRGRERDAYYVSFSPDGKVLATSSATGDAQLWRGFGPKEIALVAGGH